MKNAKHREPMRAAGACFLLAAAVVVAGCGLPDDSTPRTIAREDVPYRLLDARRSPAASPSVPRSSVTTPQVFFVNADQQLVSQAHPLNVSGLEPVLNALLASLAAGPAQGQRERGLATALGPDVRLNLLDVHERTARVAIVPADRPPDAERLPLAVGQIVLTVTSVEGVDSVVLVQDGEPLDPPLPGGERTSQPVTALDYAGLLADAAAPVRKGKPDG